MHDNSFQKRDPLSPRADEPWGPGSLDPVQEYRALAHELQASFPDMETRHLDRMVAWEMAMYGGYSVETIQQAMGEASLHLAAGHVSDVHHYVTRTVDEAMQQGPSDDGVLGWGV